MKDDYNSSLRHFTRGGQTLLHNFRMVKQIFDRMMGFCILIIIGCWLGLTIFLMPAYSRYLLFELGKAHVQLLFNSHATQVILTQHNKTYEVLCEKFVDSPLAQHTWQLLESTAITALHYSLYWGAILMIVVTYWLTRRGSKQTQDKKLRGDDFCDWKVLKQQLKKKKMAGDIILGGLPFPKGFETSHVLLHGTTGSGKSECIKALLDQIRKRGDRVILYDKSCNYTSTYFQEGRDILLNPLDARTASWHLWDECRDSADFDSIAAALIPMPTGNTDPFWITGARIIFAAYARQMQAQPHKTIHELLKNIFASDVVTIEKMLKGTEAEILSSEKVEKTALSIKTVLITYAKSLYYVKDEADPFSIRRWVRDDNQHNWLFISSLADRHESLRPLISLWLNLASNALMSLTPNPKRRIWIILDELPSLHQLPYLTQSVAEIRKFGGCFVLGLQSISQLRDLYGFQGAEGISNLCNTRIFLREPSFGAAEWVSQELGKSEVEETKEGISYSESAIRSGITTNRVVQHKQIVTPSEIMQLNNLEAYVRLIGQWPITKLTIPYRSRKDCSLPLVEREGDIFLQNMAVAAMSQGSSSLPTKKKTLNSKKKMPPPQTKNLEPKHPSWTILD